MACQPAWTSKSWPPGTPGGSWWVHSRCPTPACSAVSVNSTARQLPVPASMASRYGPLIPPRSLVHRPQDLGVHHVGGHPPGQQLGHRGDRPLRAAGQRLRGGPADVRGDEDVRHGQQRMPAAWRGPLQHVERRPAEAALFQRLAQRSLVHQRFAGRVDEVGASPHLGEPVAGEHPPVLRGQPRVQRDDVRAAQQGVQRYQLDVALVPERRRLRVVPEHGEAERPGPPGHLLPDVAEPDQAHGQAGRFGAEELPPLEHRLREAAPVEQVTAGPRHRADEQQGEGDGQLGDGLGVLARRVHHRDAAAGRGRDVHVDRPAPGAADQPQRGRAEHLGADRRAMHDEHVVPGHGAGHLGRVAHVLAQPALGLGDRRRARDLVDLHRGQLHPSIQAGQGGGVGRHRHVGVADHQDAQGHG